MVIYKTTNLINGKIYVGLNTTNDPTYLHPIRMLCFSGIIIFCYRSSKTLKYPTLLAYSDYSLSYAFDDR